MTGGATDDDESVLAQNLVVLVKWEGPHDVVDDKRNSISEASTPEQEPI